MTENKRAIATDLKRLDAHVVQPEEYDDAPELTDEQLTEADVYEGSKLVRRGRPLAAARKVPVKLRLDPVVIEYFRAGGPGWQTRINATLLSAVLRVTRKSKATKARGTAARAAGRKRRTRR